MKFKVGDKFTLSAELLEQTKFRDCSKGTVYTISEFQDGWTWFRFLDDAEDVVGVNERQYAHIILESEPYDDAAIPNFMGYETAKDFENIIDYALAHGDVALFEECVNELKTRGLLESLTS